MLYGYTSFHTQRETLVSELRAYVGSEILASHGGTIIQSYVHCVSPRRWLLRGCFRFGNNHCLRVDLYHVKARLISADHCHIVLSPIGLAFLVYSHIQGVMHSGGIMYGNIYDLLLGRIYRHWLFNRDCVTYFQRISLPHYHGIRKMVPTYYISYQPCPCQEQDRHYYTLDCLHTII